MGHFVSERTQAYMYLVVYNHYWTAASDMYVCWYLCDIRAVISALMCSTLYSISDGVGFSIQVFVVGLRD